MTLLSCSVTRYILCSWEKWAFKAFLILWDHVFLCWAMGLWDRGAAFQTPCSSCGSSLQLESPLSKSLVLGIPSGTCFSLPCMECSLEETRLQSCHTGSVQVPWQAQEMHICWSVWLGTLASAFIVEMCRISPGQGEADYNTCFPFCWISHNHVICSWAGWGRWVSEAFSKHKWIRSEAEKWTQK